MQSLWMLFASFLFSIMGVCVKLASNHYSTAEIVMYRGMVGVGFMFSFIRLRRGMFRTAFPLQHLWRGAVGVASLWLWFYAIGKLPLAPAMTLNYMSPVWLALILFAGGWLRGRTRFEWGLAVAVTASFIGVTMLLRPSFQADQLQPSIIALMSGMLSALAYLQVRRLGQLGEPEYRVVFYFSIMGLVAGVLGSLFNPMFSGVPTVWHAHTPQGVALLLGVGVSATVAQIAMTRAYRLGKTLVVANLQYTGIVFSSLWGILFWRDALGWLSWAGIGIILISGSAATFYNTRNVKRSPLETPVDAIANEV